MTRKVESSSNSSKTTEGLNAILLKLGDAIEHCTSSADKYLQRGEYGRAAHAYTNVGNAFSKTLGEIRKRNISSDYPTIQSEMEISVSFWKAKAEQFRKKERIRNQLKKANKLLSSGAHLRAINILDKIPTSDNDDQNADIWLQKGNAYCMLGDFQSSIDCYDNSIMIRPLNVETLFNKAVSLYYLSKYEEAIKCLDDTLKIYPDHKDAWFYKGLIFHNFAVKRYDEAIDCYEKALSLNMHSVRIKGNLSEALFICRRYPESEKIAKEVLESADDETYILAMRFLLVCLA